ncbi:MAG: hypothetical protein COX02_01725 [Candidatus Vogelbacteria bacterium CG22_combo_CG10-13_8_21_14_all_37_9]|uniref:Glycosyl transferase family 1 domain-containing protein n=1 Tax=Candidatus Vogelbacteria bacterium CG22_combo_CG10-13_8_21_14_all_37_9 TaxID=1975046 RepID=A0A2H0BKD7_9BACT|nr:MAG: hypothetical protein BK005_02135 [bacterium CG10_37_50]PIP58143.1 MAG: hypothetical protein COX02_01725 [Candidatus Vogelbacteria bacterium CG22_combo_CG10-13_8_21_14_all_37_9]
MPKKPIILVATGLFPPEIGGPATYAKILLEELPAHGWEVKILNFSELKSYPKLIRHLMYFTRVWKTLPLVDQVYALDPVSVGLPVMLACFFRRRSYFLRVAGDYAWEQGQQRFGVETDLDRFSLESRNYSWPVRGFKKIQTIVAYRAKQVIVPSQYLKKIVSNWGLVPGKIKVIYNAFEIDNNQIKDLTIETDKKPIIFSVGRLVPWKGFATLISIVPRLLLKEPNLQLIIAGDGPDYQFLKEQIKQLNLGANVKLLGRLSQADLFKQLVEAKVFVLNSAYEGFSHQLLEVMALGVPIVTTIIGGNPELISSGENGLLVPYDDKTALIEAIEQLLFDPVLNQKLVRGAKSRVVTFNKERMIKELIAILEDNENF